MRKVIYFLAVMLVSLSASAQKIVDDRVTDTGLRMDSESLDDDAADILHIADVVGECPV